MSLFVVVVILALIFDFINGFHDAANSIATVVSTKVLSPATAVIWAAIFNFVAFFIFKDHSVANTIAKTVQEKFTAPDMNPLPMILSGLIAAIVWNLFTWLLGMPSSSSHALFGGLIGAAFAAMGSTGVEWSSIAGKIIIPASLPFIMTGIRLAMGRAVVGMVAGEMFTAVSGLLSTSA